VAARNGYAEVVRVLLEAGAEVDTFNNVSAASQCCCAVWQSAL
jgi:ankyrin repeat protein